MIKEDAPPFEQIDLYWRVSCEEMFFSYDLPKFQTGYLRVRYSKRDLFIKTYDSNSQLPEMVSTNGGSVLLLTMAKKQVRSEIGNWAKNSITKIALGKLEKGYLMSNTGKEYQVVSRVVTKDIYTNSGTVIKDVQQAKNMGNGFYTTKGISQFDYYATQGIRVKFLGVLKELGNIFSLLSIADLTKDFDENGPDYSQPFTMSLGAFTPINQLAGVIISDMVSDMEGNFEEAFQQELAEAKAEGLKAVKMLVKDNIYGYDIEDISVITAESLLKGEFKTYSEFKDCDISNQEEEINDEFVSILVRKLNHPISNKDIFQIESIFINK